MKFKNAKVKTKLFVAMGIVLALSLVVAVSSAVGLFQLNQQLDNMGKVTLPNARSVGIMQQNMQAQINELLLALTSTDATTTTKYLDSAAEKIKENEEMAEEIRKVTRVDQSLFDALDKAVADQATVRAEYINFLNQHTEAGTRAAMNVMLNKYIPLLLAEKDALQNIADTQVTLANGRVEQGDTLYKMTMVVLVAVTILSAVISFLISSVLIRDIMTPLDVIENAVKEFQNGNFDAPVDYESADEFGQVCVSVVECQNNLKDVVGDACNLLEEMANGNFDIRSGAPERYVGGLKPMLDSIRKINHNLSDTLSQIDLGAEQVSAGAEQVSTGAQALAQGATEQASAVEELSATINEISTKSKENAKNSNLAMEHSKKAGEHVFDSAENIKQMVAAMKEISESSQEIGKIIETIENIAFQTNILALNAAVEAARAGSAGKGFAVVADEVRNLAAKSDEAAKATKDLINSSIRSVQTGDEIVNRVASSLDQTIEAAEKAQTDIELISRAADEEAEAISQITEGIDQISAVVQNNSATSEESAAASEELSSQAAIMKDLMAQFKLRDTDAGYTPNVQDRADNAGHPAMSGANNSGYPKY